MWWVVLFVGVFGLACEPPEPVLLGVTAAEESTDGGRVPGAPYVRAEGVLVDVQYLAGLNFEASRDELVRQLGDVVATREIGALEGREVTFERGAARVVEGTVYQLRVELPSPLRRSQALQAVGLPMHVDNWVVARREFRLRGSWGFTRIRMGRVDLEDERVNWVEARRWNPRDHVR